MIRLAQLRCLLLVFLPPTLSCCEQRGLQPQAQFAWALDKYGSTSQPIVRVALTNGTGPWSDQCVFADALVDALLIEQGRSRDDPDWRAVRQFALASGSHRFTLRKPAAWRKIREGDVGYTGRELKKGCRLIRDGKSAIWDDMSGQVVEGPHFES